MAETISIRERIMQQLARELEEIDGVGTVRRWDARALTHAGHLDILLRAGDARAEEAELGTTGGTLKTLSVEVHVVIIPTETDTEATDIVVNRWLAKVETALMSNRTVTEDTGSGNAEVLARAGSLHPTMEMQADHEGGVTIATGLYEVEYEHDADSPYIGPAITAYEET